MDVKEREITDRINIISRYYDIEDMLAGKKDQEAVSKYYRKSDFFYNHIHSRGGGNNHLGLSDDGLYHREDFMKQAQVVGSLLKGEGMKILEVGAGQLPNTKYLAKHFPQHHFTAMDLPNRNFLKRKVPKNVTLMEGSFDDLSFLPEESFDIVFGLETICYSGDKNRVYGEIARVLKPGGKFLSWDVNEPKPDEEMTEFERRASAICLAGMSLTRKDQCICYRRKYLEDNGFEDIQIEDLTHKTIPTLRRLDRISCYYFMHPGMIKRLSKWISQEVTRNSISGWLLLYTFDGTDIHQYNQIIATKGKVKK